MQKKRKFIVFLIVLIILSIFESVAAAAPIDYVSYWKFEGNANDETGRNNGSIKGTSLVNGTIGKAYSFDGIDDYIEVPDSSSLNTNSLTIILWMKPQTQSVNKIFLSKGYYKKDGWYLWQETDNDLQIRVNWAGSFDNDASSKIFKTGEWQQVAIVFNKTNIYYYKNGSLYAKDPKGTLNSNWKTPVNRKLIIGAYNSGYNWKGIIDELMIFNRTLTSTEILQIYNAQKNSTPYKSCIPETCSFLGKQCGNWSDGCSGSLNCGGCDSGYSCDNGVCIEDVQNFSFVYPGADWSMKTASEAGFDEAKLSQFSSYVGGKGFVTRNGYGVYGWGSYTTRADIASAAKPWNSFFLFKAIETGKIPSIDQKASVWETRLNNINSNLGYKDRNITWKNFATQTSNYGVREKPGAAFDYNDWQMALFWDTLFLKVYGATYSGVDNSVLKPMLGNILEFEDNPTFMAFGTGDRPGRIAVSPRDFARFGLLFLGKGKWKETQVISEENAIKAVSTPLPNSIPRTTGIEAQMISGQRSYGSTDIPDNQVDHDGSYSYLWWVNGIKRDGTRKYPDAPLDLYMARGHGGKRLMVVFPSLGIVASWNDANLDGDADVNQALKLLIDSVKN